MKPQKLTRALLKPGTVFWQAYVDTDPETQRTSVSLTEWRIKSVLNRRPTVDAAPVPTAFFVRKVDGHTWVKLISRSGDYGWSPNIGEFDRKSCHLGDMLPDGLATTKRRACELASHQLQVRHERLVRLSPRTGMECPEQDPEYMAEYEQEVAAAARAVAYWTTREKKPSA